MLARVAGSLLLVVLGCSDTPTERTTLVPCADDTKSVNVTVSKNGSDVVFSWSPNCAVAMLLVEAEDGDMWVATGPALDDAPSVASNVILPGVTYGVLPAGAEQDAPASPLVAGTSYEVVLWKVLPEGSTLICQLRFENFCLMAVKEFTR